MELTKKLEKEVTKAYVAYFDNYIMGNVEAIASMIDDDYNQIGSAESEVFFNKNDAVKFLYDTIDQVAGKTEIRNRILKVEPVEDLILVTDLFDIYALIESDWNFYSKFRASTLMQKKKDEWKFIHQHSSMPDTRTQDGENIAIEKISAENLQLREAVKRRTIELEQKNHELEIEASLERVRTVAMGMHKSEDLLKICEVSYKEFQKLGFENLRNALIHIPNDEQKYIMDYDYSDFTGGDIAKIKYGSHPIVDEYIKKIRSAEDAYFEVIISKDQLNDWKEFRINSGQSDDSRLDNADALYYYLFSIGIGDIGISTFKPISKSQIKILKRFRNVFDLAYRRYNDITLAEAQAREAQIEAALERVRAKAMAMHNSADLSSAASMVFTELRNLGINPIRCGVGLIDKESRKTQLYSATSSLDGDNLALIGSVVLSGHPILEKIYDTTLNNEEYFPVLSGEQLKSYYELLLKGLPVKAPALQAWGKQYGHFFPFSVGGLYAWSESPYNDAELIILRRFAAIIDLTFRRYIELQKAEAQTREAQIEAALERVRSRSMGMQKSEELKEVIQVVYEQFIHLKINVDHAGFIVDYTPKGDWHFWIADDQEIPSKITHPYFESVWANQFNEVKEKGGDFFATNLNFEEKNKFYNELLAYVPGLPEASRDFYLNCPGLAGSTVLLDSVGLYIENFSGTPYSDEENKILMRFGKVFQQTYTRFLDLQKAETQAREAQIEAALERVRSRSMAMRKSEELADLSFELVKQVHALGIDTWFCAFNIYDDDPKGSLEWGSNAQGTYEEYRTPREGIFLRYYEAGQKGETLLVNEIDEDECPRHYEYLCTLPGVGEQLLQMKDAGIPFPTSQIDHVAYFKYGYIIFITFEPALEAHNTFKRFAKVFEQSYTRFLDLQKAEEQVRLAEQQASLDRVRAEIASMRTTDDLEKITPLIWRELTTLGIPFFRCGVFIFDEPNAIAHAYLSTPLGKSLAALHVKINDTWLENAIKHWRQAKIYHEIWDREQFIAWTQTMMDLGFVESKEQFQAGKEAPEILSLQLFPFTQGMLYVGSKHPLSEEEIETAQKLADDFGVAYSRYEDFKKLEEANHRKSIELEEARQLQLAMLPKTIPELPNLEIAVYMQTATEVGGDYYDFHVGEDGTLTAVIGDATGHGMKAGTMVTITKSLFNSLAYNENILDTFTSISSVIKEMKFRQLSMCLLMMKIKDNKLSISSAAMPPALIYRKKTKSVEEIFIKAMPLGTMSNFPYSIEETLLEQGDTVLLMSDGFPELQNANGEMYGYERGINKLRETANKSPEEIIGYLKNDAANWAGDRDPDDDITFVAVKVKKIV